MLFLILSRGLCLIALKVGGVGVIRLCLSYRSIFFGLLLGTIVTTVEVALNAYMGIHFWGLETDQLRLLPVAVLAGLPIGAVVAANLVKVLDKKWCLIIPAGYAILNGNIAIVLRLMDLLPPNGDPIILPLVMGISFLGAVTVPVVLISINSMFADISDEMELETGERQEGIIYSARAFAGKAAGALGTMVAGFALDVIAFPKNAMPGTVDPDVIWYLGFVQGPLTSVFTFTGLLLYFNYRLSRQRHVEIVKALAARRKASSANPAVS